MARKRALIERIEPGFYDQPDIASVPDDQPGRALEVAYSKPVPVNWPAMVVRLEAIWQWLDDPVPWGDHLATDEFLLRGRAAVRNLRFELRQLDLGFGGDGDA
jgi:hypothetical protein